MSGSKPIDLTGIRVGRLVVIERAGSASNGAGSTPTWRCRCDCGEFTVVRGAFLRYGRTISCGCARTVAVAAHGQGGGRDTPRSREFEAWTSMLQRCTNPRSRGWPDYGGRGITVCERWRSFENFLADVGPRPSDNHSIDRIKNDRGYEPGNARWATPTEQARNRRSVRVVEHHGEALPAITWAERVGMPAGTLRKRLAAGWATERALTTPVRPRRPSASREAA